MPRLPVTAESTVAAMAEMGLEDGDVFVCSYPKSGTTWTQAVVAALLMPDQANGIEHVSDVAPFLDIDAHWKDGTFVGTENSRRVREQTKRRAFNTHMLYEHLPTKSPRQDVRFIYVVRDGRDVCVSFYHHLANQLGEAGTYEKPIGAFFDEWLDGTLPYGGWLDHLKAWSEGANDPRVLFLAYEDMLSDLPGAVRRIAAHIGVPPLPDDRVHAELSLEGMRARRDVYQPKSVAWKSGFNFLRKGVAGDHRVHLDEEQLRRFDAHLLQSGGVPSCYPSSVRGSAHP